MAKLPELVIAIDGREYRLRTGDITAIDARDFAANVGISLAQGMAMAAAGGGDIHMVAGLVWLIRRKRERGLTFAKVANAITYESELTSHEEAEEATEDDDPET